jgi:hypothetical protein
MLFRNIENYLGFVPGRVLPKLNEYIKTLNTKRLLLEERYTASYGNESNCIKLLHYLLASDIMGDLLKKSSDIDRYFDVIQPSEDDISNIFDATSSGKIYQNMFIKKSAITCEEYLLPVKTLNPLQYFPMDKGWSHWKKVRPVRLVDINSHELTFNTVGDQVYFKKDHPTYAIITIDTGALLLQYTNFLLEKDINHDDVSLPTYIHQHVTISLVEDLQNLWLRNQYLKIIDAPYYSTVRETDVNKYITDVMYGHIGSEYTQSMIDIYSLIKQCKDGTMTPEMLIGSLQTSRGSVTWYLYDMVNHCSLPDLRQYMWMVYLRDIRWIELISKVYKLNRDYIGTRNLMNTLKREIPIIANMKIQNNIRSSRTRALLEVDMNTRLQQLLN